MAPPPKKKRTWLIVLVIVGVVLIALIGGCAAILGSAAKGVSEAFPSPVAGAPSTAGQTTEPTEDPTDQPSNEPEASSEAGIKDTYTWEDGVEAKISKVEHRKISDMAAGGRPGEDMVVLTIKITNKSKQNLDADLVSIDLSYGQDGESAETVYDSQVLGDNLSGTISKGRSKSGDYAFAVPAKQQGDVVVEITPGFDYSAALFTGSVKK